MRKRPLLWCLGLLAFVATWAFVALRMMPGVRLDAKTVAQIKEGMTLAEVEAIVGGPPGRYSNATPRSTLCLGEGQIRIKIVSPDLVIELKAWLNDEGYLLVAFFPEEKVSITFLDGVRVPNRSYLDKLRRWLPW